MDSESNDVSFNPGPRRSNLFGKSRFREIEHIDVNSLIHVFFSIP
jgi:hypothetical protein